MGNLINLPNITPESIIIEGNSTAPVKKTGNFDTRNYLNVRLGADETERTLTIRLLPMDLQTGNPFVKVHVHNVKVPQEMVKPGEKPYKSYICLAKTTDIDHDKFGNKCPFCEINRAAYTESTKATDPAQKKALQDVSIANLSKEAVIVRCIERGKEDEGVKFWKFNVRADKTDPYNQILKLYTLRKENAEKKGKTLNILDIYNGHDLNITITAEGTAAPQIMDDSDCTPLSENEEQMKAWIYDTKKWQDVFTCKPYDYLSLVSQSRVPWFDKANGVWVDKEEYDNGHESTAAEADAEIEAARQSLNAQATEEKAAPAPKDDLIASITVEEDDLPF